ncbi:UNVERIFIED_CONTAM: hypothetical protein PYX00_007206 [Menopon gallinae]|uniref:Nuclear receptor-binding factor 2 MIT domain-containing protein n=1 Tax=Menopon gallinae TaxID=328185 RepID=A0AAW2HJ00_9NEOP
MSCQAHFYDRRASAYARKFLFDEAIECHSAACQELEKSYKLTSNSKAVESIKLQHEYHKKQKDFLRLKKLQYHTYKEALRVQKEAMSRIMKARGARENESENDSQGATLKKAIFRTIEEADSLLELLVQRDDEDGSSVKQENCLSNKETSNVSSGSKRPKDDTTVIEELKIVNYQLRYVLTVGFLDII